MDQMIAWVLVNHCVLRLREQRRRGRRAGPSWLALGAGAEAPDRAFR